MAAIAAHVGRLTYGQRTLVPHVARTCLAILLTRQADSLADASSDEIVQVRTHAAAAAQTRMDRVEIVRYGELERQTHWLDASYSPGSGECTSAGRPNAGNSLPQHVY